MSAMNIGRLIVAAEEGQLDKLEHAIADGSDLDKHDEFGRTAMLVAAHNDRLAFMQRLVAAGATLEAHDTTAQVKYYYGANARGPRERWTLLHAAAQHGAHDVITWLLGEHGYEIDAHDHGGRTPLHVAASSPLATVATLDLLLARGADPNAEDALGHNAVAHARDLPRLRRLLDAGGHPDGGNFVPPIDDPRAEVPARPLAVAVGNQDREAVALLLERGTQQFGDALEHAATFAPDLVPLLVERGVKPLGPGLRSAASSSPDLVALLLEHGPSDAEIVIAMAYAREEETFAQLLGALREVPAHALLGAATAGRAAALLARGVSPNASQDADGKTALHLAAERGDLALVKVLVEAGANPNALDGKRKSPRALAYDRGEDEAVRRFLEPITRLPPPPAPSQPRGLAAGDRVRHPKFGAGAVLRVIGDKASVKFDGDAGEKTLLARVLVTEPGA